MEIFVGNLSFAAMQEDVKQLFEGFGNVAAVKIVMRKEKKAPKSRGFGFVEMPDQQQALAAIEALNGKEFMGRALDVNPARPKAETQAGFKSDSLTQQDAVVEEVQHPREEREEKKPRFKPLFNRSGGYKGGRRTHSYMKRQGLTTMSQEVKPRQRSFDNPMRWRTNKDQARPWQKSSGEHAPWKKSGGESRPWKKTEGEFKPWHKTEGGSKPWKKPAGDWKKPEGDARPWKKPSRAAKAWKKPAGAAKPWSESNGPAQKARFHPVASAFDKFRSRSGGAKRVSGARGASGKSGARSRTKGRRNP